MPQDTTLTAHTDGACSGNPGPGGWGVVFSNVQGIIVSEHSGHAPATTNNRMETTAVREAVKLTPPGIALEIATDSLNVIGWLSQGWKRKEPNNATLCREIDSLILTHKETGGRVSFRHVRGHQGDVLNERADRLATDAAKGIVVTTNPI